MTEATLFVGGRILAASGRSEALLTEDGRVAAIGEEATVRRSAPTGSERVDLAGGLVLPGLADAHLHLGEMARLRAGIDTQNAGSIPALLERLRQAVSERDRPLLAAYGFQPERVREGRWPSTVELEEAVPGIPVVLFHASAHAARVNRVALDALGLEPQVRDRDEGPDPTFTEEELRPVHALIDRALPLSFQALRETIGALHRFGLIAVGTMNTGPNELATLAELARRGELTMRVRAYPPLDTAPEAAAQWPADPSGHLAVAGGKAFLDGAFGPRTAALDAPYLDAEASRGADREDDRTLQEGIAAAAAAGLAPALHAIGDRAVRRAGSVLRGVPEGLVPRIEHASLTPPSVLTALQGTTATLVVQPSFVTSDSWLPRRLGAARARWAYLFRSLADLGLRLAGSSDAPCEDPDPWRGIRAAVERQDAYGASANPRADQRLPVAEALALYTVGAHRAIRCAGGGSLVPGGPADLVVVDAPNLEAAVATSSGAVRSTWSEGRSVWSRGASAGGGA